MMKYLESLQNALPVILQIRNKKCVVVGSTPGAISKANILLRAGAKVHVAGMEPGEHVLSPEHADSITYRPAYTPELIDKAFLVIAASESGALNKEILSECQFRNIPCSAPDHHYQGSDFILPASLSYQGLVISITGQEHDFAHIQHVRKMLQDFLYSTEPSEIIPKVTPGKGVVVVTHFSSSEDANDNFLDRVDFMRFNATEAPLEPAFIGEGSDPDLATAVKRLIESGVREITVVPFFLFKGRRLSEDVPTLMDAAIKESGATGVTYEIQDPIGDHPLVGELMLSIVGKYLSK